MDIARIEKRIGVRASTDRLWEIIADLPGWDRWNPIETSVEGTIAYGGQISLTETIESLPERRAVARVGEWQPYAQLVWMEKRGLWFRSMRYFEIEELEPGSCIVANGFIFSGLRGEMFFDKHRIRLRHAVDAVAEAWKATAEV
ncbi:SRPBCC domain-containing protein [Brevundimonas sp.]|uniref:SRPBCC domain-containing protein n=1 Tax=Brevundimonas sp. TaxID=1871086 RepID=UPI002D41597C|nr:SRPBCC domain-containing protein [Brevundimonas sp.]HYC67158.1 SRPBCC domain-containing protein [Brevundimonas sp.]